MTGRARNSASVSITRSSAQTAGLGEALGLPFSSRHSSNFTSHRFAAELIGGRRPGRLGQVVRQEALHRQVPVLRLRVPNEPAQPWRAQSTGCSPSGHHWHASAGHPQYVHVHSPYPVLTRAEQPFVELQRLEPSQIPLALLEGNACYSA